MRLLEGIAYSAVCVSFFHNLDVSPKIESLTTRLVNRYKLFRMEKRQRKFFLAKKRGKKKALNALNIKGYI